MGRALRPIFLDPPAVPLTLPGTYTATLAREVDGEVAPLTGPRQFDVVSLELATFAAKDRQAVLAFRNKVARLQRAVQGALRTLMEKDLKELEARLEAAGAPWTPGRIPDWEME